MDVLFLLSDFLNVQFYSPTISQASCIKLWVSDLRFNFILWVSDFLVPTISQASCIELWVSDCGFCMSNFTL